MNRRRHFALVALAVATLACTHAFGRRAATAYATFHGPEGERRGEAELWEDENRVVHVNLELEGLPPGTRAIHFHAVGRCDGGPSPFTTAGPHYNPIGRQHGLNNRAGPHAGDAPNIEVEPNGQVSTSFTTDRVTLTQGSTTLFDADSSAIVIHSGADDQVSQPAGNAGGRIACAVVTRGR